MAVSVRACGLAGIIAALIAAGPAPRAQNAPEPPLPGQAGREARAAAAAIQTPRDLKPAPPVPSPMPPPPGAPASALEPVKPGSGSPIPLQPPEVAAAPSRTAPPPGGGASSPLPTGFESKVTSSTSGSGQFKVYGKDLHTRSPFTSHCDEAADRLRRLLHDDRPWVLPVVVSVRTGAEAKTSGPAVSTSISQIANGGFHLQATVNVRPDLRPSDLDIELTRILIAERILRNHKEITTKRSMVLPEWLLTGVSQAMTFRDRSRPSAVFTAIFRSGKIYGIEEILDAAPGQLDALSRTIYETSCCTLVLALLDQPEGPLGMRKFLSLLAVDSRDDRALLDFCFPRLALSASSLNKWWSLQMASLATPSVFETLGATQTKKQLAEALMIHYETTVDAAPRRSAVAAGTPDADTPPEPAPEEEKKRSLIGRIFGGSSGDKKSGEESETTEPKARPAAEAKAEAEAAHEEKKRGIFGRMFGARGASEEPAEESKDKESKKADEPSAPKTESKKVGSKDKEAGKSKDEKKPSAQDEPPSEEKKPGFLGRMFGGGGTKTADETKEEPKTETKKTDEPKKPEKPKPEAKESSGEKTKGKAADKPKESRPSVEEEDSEPKKRGFLGRMFGGGAKEPPKSEDEPPKKSGKKSDDKKSDEDAEGAAKKKSAALAPDAEMTEAASALIALAEGFAGRAAAWWSDRASPADGGHEVKLRLPFGRKKEEAEESKSEEKPAEKKKKSEPEKKASTAGTEPEPKKKPEPAAKPKAKARTEAPKPRLVPVSIPLEDYANIMKRKDRAQILEGTINSLHALQTRANVLFRPIIGDYMGLLGELQAGKSKDVDKRLAELRSRTAKAYERAKAVEDHLDVFEANETKNYSGAFEDYLHLPAQIQKELPVRDDPLSKYLDALDEEYSR